MLKGVLILFKVTAYHLENPYSFEVRNFFSAAFLKSFFGFLTAVKVNISRQELTPDVSKELLLSFRRDGLYGLVVLL